jgi:hypothetical protein
MSDLYEITSFDGLMDEELARASQLFEALLDEMKAWDVEDAEDAASGKFPPPAQPYCESPRFKDLMRLLQGIEVEQKRRIEQDAKDSDVDDEVLETPIHSPAQSQSSLPPNYESSNNVVVTPPPDIIAPQPFPPSPNIFTQQSQSRSPSPQNQQPPDILTPLPLPLAPNINSHRSLPHLYPIRIRRALDILPPRSLPLKPNIPIHHPPAQPQAPTPKNHRRKAIRRISKKRHSGLFQMFEDEHCLEGTRCVETLPRPFPLDTHFPSLSCSFSFWDLFSLFHRPLSISFL